MAGLKIKQFLTLLISASILLMPTTVLAETYYDFSDEAQARFEQTEKNQPKEIKTEPTVEKAKKNSTRTQPENTQKIITSIHKTIEGNVIYIAENTSFNVVLQSSINSASLTNNDTIAGTLVNDWVYKNRLIAPSGSVVYGRALNSKKAGLFFANGTMTITFDSILLPNGEQLPLTANVVTIKAKGNRIVKSAARIAGGALVGVFTGVLYALASGGDVTRGVAVGASMGAGGGLINSAFSKGDDAEIPAGTLINVRLTKPMSINTYRD